MKRRKTVRTWIVTLAWQCQCHGGTENHAVRLIYEGSRVRGHVGGDLSVELGKWLVDIIMLRLGSARELGTIFYSFRNDCAGHHAEVGKRAMRARETVARRVSSLLAAIKLRRKNE